MLDFAIVLNYVDLSKYDYLPMAAEDSWGVVMRKDDLLAKRKRLGISDLKNLPLICSRQWIDQELPDWFGYNLSDINIVATYNLPYNGAVMAKASIGYAIMLDKLVHTGEDSRITFRPLTDVPKAKMFVIWRKNQTFSSIAKLFLKEMKNNF